ncbi:MAG: hypothetical protein GYB33_00200 [Gammaproteobacteria bacterium]|nr:hypothetical protein [Gammaproteobacteria bacterium]
MNTRSQIIAAWCGPLFMLLFGLGWIVTAGFFPPLSPELGGVEVASFYQANPMGIRLGILLSMWGTAAFLPFSAVIYVQLARIEGPAPVWAYTHLMAAAGTLLTLAFPVLFWAATAFRLDRSPELIQLLSDLAWLPFVGMTVPFLVIPICIAIVGFGDKSQQPTFPRWACYFNLWADLLILPGGLVIFFKTGPFAWDGLIGIWLPLIAFAAWFVVMAYLLIKAAQRQALAAG